MDATLLHPTSQRDMFIYSDDDEKIIINYDFSHVIFIGENSVTEETGGKRCDEIFAVGQRWKNKELLVDAVAKYAGRTGWLQVKKYNTHIKCSCFKNPPKDGKKREFANGSLHLGCTWDITMKPFARAYTNVENKDGTKKRRAIFDDEVAVEISKAHLEHGEYCNPSTRQQRTQRARSGANVKPLSVKQLAQVLQEVISKYESCGKETKFALSSLSISLKEMAVSDGQSKGILDEFSKEKSVHRAMRDLMHQHNTSSFTDDSIKQETNSAIIM